MELCIIGNGFDLAHGTPSSYYSFRDYVKAKDRKLFDTIEQFIHIDDFWGDFEGNLSRLSRETIMICVDTMADTMIDCYDESNDDFSYADFYVALELGTETISTIVNNIHQDFWRWIETLCPGKPAYLSLDPAGQYINFNYTEFLETLYGVPKENIVYIHGDRRDKDTTLVLGHGEDPTGNLEQWLEAHQKDSRYQPFRCAKKGRRYRNDDLIYLAYFTDFEYTKPGRYKTRQAIADAAATQIEGYYAWTYKMTEAVLEQYETFFQSLHDVEYITVMGHSLSPVDYPYFKRILDVNRHRDNIHWRISWHGPADKEKIQRFATAMKIPEQQIELFRMDAIESEKQK